MITTLLRDSELNSPTELWPGASPTEVETVIRAVYRQVLGNTHVMESERLHVAESQLQAREITVRDFVRHVATSQLYRDRFFHNCYRYRGIELNFKHLLGRAPQDYQEMSVHSQILDQHGFEAEIDSYLESDEYMNAFGDHVVPFYRGHTTQVGVNAAEFAHMQQLFTGNATSDADTQPKLTRSLISALTYNPQKPTDVNSLLAQVLGLNNPPPAIEPPRYQPFYTEILPAPQQLRETIQAQAGELESLQAQLAELRPFASIGASQVSNFTNFVDLDKSQSWQDYADVQAQRIATLREQIADARRLATIGEARLNRWRSRVFTR
ncbi:phycobilisome rod-core linker polypeptide [Calothrix sp. NIES-3974]|uniref:phycobilisome rod-core linker polypeptide n=1 Tax=Calothrix sp. NIES-3974 TaxID=2005462 RepID=UPI000B605B8E|nr:phycobilisome rod-core linker polypeptide [Calothrix sp. NIES-3974]BAZ04026.1 phycoerythrin-associated linker protein CpeC [Calothrix sp. NIES-3974]